jgi:hypothetical protein
MAAMTSLTSNQIKSNQLYYPSTGNLSVVPITPQDVTPANQSHLRMQHQNVSASAVSIR